MIMSMMSLVLDFVLLSGLGVTIFYCLRLSKHLKAFRSTREEFFQVIKELNENIETAEMAVNSMKNASRGIGDKLETRIEDAKRLVDELSFMNQSGESLAKRLENIAGQSRRSAQGDDGLHENSLDDDAPVYSKSFQKDVNVKEGVGKKTVPWARDASVQSSRNNGAEDKNSFFIQDRDFGAHDDGFEDEFKDELVSAGGGADTSFKSKAERDLYEALQKNTQGKAG